MLVSWNVVDDVLWQAVDDRLTPPQHRQCMYFGLITERLVDTVFPLSLSQCM